MDCGGTEITEGVCVGGKRSGCGWPKDTHAEDGEDEK